MLIGTYIGGGPYSWWNMRERDPFGGVWIPTIFQKLVLLDLYIVVVGHLYNVNVLVIILGELESEFKSNTSIKNVKLAV